MLVYSPRPNPRTYVRVGGKIGLAVGFVALFIYMIYAGLIFSLIVDQFIPGLDFIMDALYAIAYVVCTGIGGLAGMLLGLVVYCIAAAIHRNTHPKNSR